MADAGEATRPVGGAGEDDTEAVVGVADASGDAVLVPIELIAYTL